MANGSGLDLQAFGPGSLGAGSGEAQLVRVFLNLIGSGAEAVGFDTLAAAVQDPAEKARNAAFITDFGTKLINQGIKVSPFKKQIEEMAGPDVAAAFVGFEATEPFRALERQRQFREAAAQAGQAQIIQRALLPQIGQMGGAPQIMPQGAPALGAGAGEFPRHAGTLGQELPGLSNETTVPLSMSPEQMQQIGFTPTGPTILEDPEIAAAQPVGPAAQLGLGQAGQLGAQGDAVATMPSEFGQVFDPQQGDNLFAQIDPLQFDRAIRETSAETILRATKDVQLAQAFDNATQRAASERQSIRSLQATALSYIGALSNVHGRAILSLEDARLVSRAIAENRPIPQHIRGALAEAMGMQANQLSDEMLRFLTSKELEIQDALIKTVGSDTFRPDEENIAALNATVLQKYNILWSRLGMMGIRQLPQMTQDQQLVTWANLMQTITQRKVWINQDGRVVTWGIPEKDGGLTDDQRRGILSESLAMLGIPVTGDSLRMFEQLQRLLRGDDIELTPPSAADVDVGELQGPPVEVPQGGRRGGTTLVPPGQLTAAQRFNIRARAPQTGTPAGLAGAGRRRALGQPTSVPTEVPTAVRTFPPATPTPGKRVFGRP